MAVAGFSFVWSRINVTLPETVGGHTTRGVRVQFETCVDDYGEIWIDGECNRERGGIRSANGNFVLQLVGYQKAKNYDGSMGEWANQDDTPMEV